MSVQHRFVTTGAIDMFARPVLGCALLLLVSAEICPGADKTSKKVLVELYTSQGCNSCPPANDLLGQLAKLGYGDDKIVPIAFHVDYFNLPWADPFSDNTFSQRELAYNDVLQRKDLYFTPMMMVDGRTPMLGSNKTEALRAIKKSLADDPGVALNLNLVDDKTTERLLKLEVSRLTSEIKDRTVMIGVTVTEGPISTKIPSGENAGRILIEPFVVRSFTFKKAKLDVPDPVKFEFPLKLAKGSVASRCRVAVFAQDWDKGQVYQAESIPWLADAAKKVPN